MAKYVFETLTATAALALACGPNLCMADDGADGAGAGGGAASPPPPPPPAASKPAKPKSAPSPKPAAKPVSDDGLVEAEVKRGTVMTDDGPVGPGGTVRLDADTVARMRRDGLLVDPDNAPLPAFDGPQISQG